jgi:hypothetical protein
MALSVWRIYSVNDMIDKYVAVGGMENGRGNQSI